MVRVIGKSDRVPEFQVGQFAWRIKIGDGQFLIPDEFWPTLWEAREDCLRHLTICKSSGTNIASAYIAGVTDDYYVSQHSIKNAFGQKDKDKLVFGKANLKPKGFLFSWLVDNEMGRLDVLAKLDPHGDSNMAGHSWKQLREAKLRDRAADV